MKNSKGIVSFLVIFGVLIALVIIGVKIVGGPSGISGLSDVLPPKKTVPSVYPNLSETPIDWETYVSEGVVDYFDTFALSYPNSWKIKVNKNRNPPPSLTVTLTKDNNAITILQVPSSEATCLFPDDPDQEGMFVKYDKYLEIPKSDDTLWRRVVKLQTTPESFYKVCEKKAGDKFFQGATSMGVITLRGPAINDQILSEFDNILSQLQFSSQKCSDGEEIQQCEMGPCCCNIGALCD